MFATKKKKIQVYLNGIPNCNKTAFDFLLIDYLDRTLKKDMESIGLTKIEIHIDWFDDIKCIGIQAKCQKYYMDLQIYPNEFHLSFDLDEPDEDKVYPLESKGQLYTIITQTIQSLRQDIA